MGDQDLPDEERIPPDELRAQPPRQQRQLPVPPRAAEQVRAPDDPSLWGTMWGWTFGTPTAVQAADGTLLVTFFAAGLDGVSAIRCVRVEP